MSAHAENGVTAEGMDSRRLKDRKWRIRIVFLKTERANMSRAMKDWKNSIVCFVIARFTGWNAVRENLTISKRTERESRFVPIALFRTGRRIMIRSWRF